MSADIAVVGVPTDVAEAVRGVYVQCAGHDLAGNLLAAAAAGNETLRGYFEWDNDKAAHEWRLTQAEALVRRVKVTLIRGEDQEPITVRAYIARRELPQSADTKPGSFVAIEDIAGATEQEAALVESIRRDLRRLQAKYRHVQDFLSIVSEELAP